MFGAGSARRLHCLSQSFSRAMHSDARIVLRDASSLRQLSQTPVFQINHLDGLSILGLQFDQHLPHASARNIANHGIGFRFCFEFANPALRGTLGSGFVSVMIDQGISQKPIEPGDCRFLVAQFPTLLDSSQEGSLEDVLRNFAALYSALQET